MGPGTSPFVFARELRTAEQTEYEAPSLHRTLVNDRVRCLAYKKAIEETVRKGDIVLDVGAGTGILAMFASRCGAAKVYAAERTNVSYWAKLIVAKNKLHDTVEVIRKDVRRLDVKRGLDVIVSECIGHFAMDENMFESVLFARDNMLKKGGKIIPSGIRLIVSVGFCETIHSNFINYWKHKMYGLDFSPLEEAAINCIYLANAAKGTIVSPSFEVYDFDCYRASSTNIDKAICLGVNCKTKANGLWAWFNAQLSEHHTLTSSPYHRSTHWKQCFLPFYRTIWISPRDELRFEYKQKKCLSRENDDRIEFAWKVMVNGNAVCNSNCII